jgi:hypothetical protein
MADLPITSDEGATPVVINDPVTTANIAHVTAANELQVAGTRTNNNAAPPTTLLASANYIANAVAPTWVEGNLVLGSVDLSGNTRVIGTKTNNNAAPGTQIGVLPAIANAAAPTWVEGNQVLLSTDLTGAVRTVGKTKATYSCAPASIALASACTDAMTISGSATKTIRVIRIQVMGIKTTAGQELVMIEKRSTANTGGTFTAGVITPHDSTNPAVTATVNVYTANPTALGALVGFVRSARVFWPAVLSVTAPSILVYDFTSLPDQGIVLRGTAETLAINLQSGTVAGDIMFPSIDWTEE